MYKKHLSLHPLAAKHVSFTPDKYRLVFTNRSGANTTTKRVDCDNSIVYLYKNKKTFSA
jgi:hypothetical protein